MVWHQKKHHDLWTFCLNEAHRVSRQEFFVPLSLGISHLRREED